MPKDQDLKRTSDTSNSETEAISNPGKTPGPPATNPFSHEGTGATGGTGGVNPSGPTAGTEGWGLAGGEAANTTGTGPAQLGNEPTTTPGGSSSPGGLERTERDEVPLTERTFRCADAGNVYCRWETSAHTEDELMDRIERHGRDVHGIQNFDDSTKRKFQDAIRERRAA